MNDAQSRAFEKGLSLWNGQLLCKSSFSGRHINSNHTIASIRILYSPATLGCIQLTCYDEASFSTLHYTSSNESTGQAGVVQSWVVSVGSDANFSVGSRGGVVGIHTQCCWKREGQSDAGRPICNHPPLWRGGRSRELAGEWHSAVVQCRDVMWMDCKSCNQGGRQDHETKCLAAVHETAK